MSSLIGSDEIRDRQHNLMRLIDKSCYVGRKPNLVLIRGSTRSFLADTKIPSTHFKQNSDFIYLTGLTGQQSADCVLALMAGDGQPLEAILFAPFHNSNQQLWEGNDIREHSLWINSVCDDLRDISTLQELVDSEIESRQLFVSKSGLSHASASVISNLESSDKLNSNLNNYLNLKTNSTLHKVSPFLDQLRVIKSKSECDAMRRVCSIGAEALFRTMVWTQSMSQNNFISESQIAAKLEFESRMGGARKLAFPTVCGSGHRTAIIHYGANDQLCEPNDWIQIDVGCEDVDGYNSDISRTWPLNGHSANQKLRNELHDALCHVQSSLISALSGDPMMTLDLLFKLMCSLLGKVLVEFNAVDSCISSQEAAALAYRFCPHHVSHYLGIYLFIFHSYIFFKIFAFVITTDNCYSRLGLDVHDCPSISRNIPLKPGHCFTVEPGLYFHNNNAIKKEFRGIGMRVEDVVLINSEGKLEIVTKGCPHKPNL